MNSQELRNLQEAYMEVYSDLDEAKIDDNLSGQKKKDIRNERSKFGGSSSSKSKKTKLRHDLHKKYRGLKKVPGDKSAEKEIAVLRNSQRMHGTLPKIQKIGGPKGLPEQTDLYDIILSHLLDEGYAETQEQAEVIMVNMSENWRESICEGYKKLPVGKMIRQASNKTIDALEYQDGSKETPKGQDSYTAANRPWDHIDKMQKIANNHNPTKAKRKEDDNRRIGGRKRDAGRPRSNELQDNW